jgi:hypothetical protein
MTMELEEILSQRIKKHCLPLFNDSHYKHAAHEAMIQMEQALKEKGRVKDKRFGTTLISSLFKKVSYHPFSTAQIPVFIRAFL